MKKAILLLSFLAFISCGNSTPNESDAKEVARAAVLQNIKNPVGMTFHQNDVVTEFADNVFEYKETINATNSFGGSIKQDVTVQVKWIKDDPSEVSNWTVVDIQFADR